MSLYTHVTDLPRYQPNPLFEADAYKTGHKKQYPAGFERAYANLTPRSFKRLRDISPYPDAVKGVVFGVHDAIIELVTNWHDNFFSQPFDDVINPYTDMINAGLGGRTTVDSKHVCELHALGKVPLKFWVLDEGTEFNEGIPLYVVSNTDERFAWFTNYIEDQLSADIWKYLTVASISRMYWDVVVRAHLRHCKAGDFINLKLAPRAHSLIRQIMNVQIHDFSLRGLAGRHDGARTGASVMLYTAGSDNLSAANYIVQTRDQPWSDPIHGPLFQAPPATEHSVMCIRYEMDGEPNTVRDLITKDYPTGMVSIVADTRNYWNFLDVVLPSLRGEILGRPAGPSGPGKVVVRPDSGTPLKVLCGVERQVLFRTVSDDADMSWDEAGAWLLKHARPEFESRLRAFRLDPEGSELHSTHYLVVTSNGRGDYSFHCFTPEAIGSFRPATAEEMGTYETLWKHFGGMVTIDIHGRPIRQINPKVGAIYGDSITPKVADAIFRTASAHCFDPLNVFLGAGSYSFQYLTRDTMATAIKLTSAKVDGAVYSVQRTPQGDTTKHSARGALQVTYDSAGESLVLTQHHDLVQEDLDSGEYGGQLLKPLNLDEYTAERQGGFMELRTEVQDLVIIQALDEQRKGQV